MADSHIWEEDPVRLNVRASGIKKSAKVTFVFKTDDTKQTEVGTADVAVTAGTCTGTLAKTKKVADVDDGAFFYKTKYEIDVDGKKKKGFDDRIFVYARNITITALNATDGSKLEGAKCLIVQKGAVPSRTGHIPELPYTTTTDAEGKIDFYLWFPSTDLTIQWMRPFHGEWQPGKDKGRTREAKVTYAPRAKLVYPQTGSEQRQYVNLDPAGNRDDDSVAEDDKHREFGRTIRVVVGFVDDVKDGQKVFLKAKFDAKNSKRDGAAKKAGETLELETTVTGGGKQVSFDVDLGPAGGDKVEIEVGTVKGKADDKATIITWRRLFYELLAPQSLVDTLPEATCSDGSDGFDLPAAIKDAVTKELDKVFVDYTLGKSIPVDDATVPAHNKIPSEYLGQPAGKTLLVYTDVDWGPAKFAGKGFTDAGADLPRTQWVKLCHECVNDTTTAATITDTFTKNKKIDLDTQSKHDAYVFEKNPHNGANGVEVATWEADITGLDVTQAHPGITGGAARKGNLKITYVNYTRVRFELPNTAVDDPGKWVGSKGKKTCPVKIVIKMKLPDGMFEGCAGAGRQLLTVSDEAPKACGSTICHELGHAMGMTIVPGKNKKPKGSDDAKHVDNGGTYYRNLRKGTADKVFTNGVRTSHQGAHCSTGISGVAKKADLEGMNGKCTMYGEGEKKDPPPQTGYCATCVTYLKARCLEDVRTGYESLPEDKC